MIKKPIATILNLKNNAENGDALSTIILFVINAEDHKIIKRNERKENKLSRLLYENFTPTQ